MPSFDKYWNDLKKHRKRVECWLPYWKGVAASLSGRRPMRYFTLCARSMIDVFMLIRAGVLKYDEIDYAIESVSFCESDIEQFNEIRDMVSREGAGFFGSLERLFLFEDNDYTGQFPTLESIDLEFETLGESVPRSRAEELRLKRVHLEVVAAFPYDCINLDFCGYYYPEPPDMLLINKTIQRILDWQRRPSSGGEHIEISEFLLAVTCKHDAVFPLEAKRRLRELIRENCADSDVYSNEIKDMLGETSIDEWPDSDSQNFFLSGWPKDIARSAKERGWKTDIQDYVYYERVGDAGNSYLIVCLVLKFVRAAEQPDYTPAALFALRRENRKFILDIQRDSEEGQLLLADLAEVVAVRNAQAVRKRREELPGP
jgi:hypothetical protein